MALRWWWSATTYDDTGNVILVTSKLRFHDASGTGALEDATSGVKARVSHNAFYHDDANRLVAQVNVGTNGGSGYNRPGSVPSRSDTVLVGQVKGISFNINSCVRSLRLLTHPAFANR